VTTKKLIEVALPQDAINAASAREKPIRHGHPSTLNLWWAWRPLALIFAQMVDDPSAYLGEEAEIEAKRGRLFRIIEDLVVWKNFTIEQVLNTLGQEVLASLQWHKEWEGLKDENAKLPGYEAFGGQAWDLTFPLFKSCERAGWAEEARSYNALVIAWPDLIDLSASAPKPVSYVQSDINL
jgi:hypothetical protein